MTTEQLVLPLNLTDYAKRSLRFANIKGRNYNLQHAALGLITESAELCDAVKRQMVYGKDPDIANIREEIGDVMWYAALACYALRAQMEPEDVPHSGVESAFTLVVTLAACAGVAAARIDDFTSGNSLSRGVPGLTDDVQGILGVLALVAAKWGTTLGECGEINIRKLAVRYPNGFNPDSALNRDLVAERAVLEQASAAVG